MASLPPLLWRHYPLYYDVTTFATMTLQGLSRDAEVGELTKKLNDLYKQLVRLSDENEELRGR